MPDLPRDSGNVRSPFDDVPPAVIGGVLDDRWELQLESLVYAPVGAGAYHWGATGRDGRRWFVTCDDLDTKPWLGNERDTVFDGLLTAYGAAVDLRRAGADFVVAPVRSRSGGVAERIDGQHALAVFDHVDGEPGEWGDPLDERSTDDLVVMLAALHRGAAPAPRRPLALPGRAGFDRLLLTVDEPWPSGPLGEPARRLVRAGSRTVAAWLASLDRATASDTSPSVVTHGEPHPGNLIRTARGLRLVDWDTVALAPPERDLWMLTDVEPGIAERYADLTGTVLDDDLLAAYRTLWALADIASYGAQLSAVHDGNADDHHALAAIGRILDGAEPRPYRQIG